MMWFADFQLNFEKKWPPKMIARDVALDRVPWGPRDFDIANLARRALLPPSAAYPSLGARALVLARRGEPGAAPFGAGEGRAMAAVRSGVSSVLGWPLAFPGGSHNQAAHPLPRKRLCGISISVPVFGIAWQKFEAGAGPAFLRAAFIIDAQRLARPTRAHPVPQGGFSSEIASSSARGQN